MSRLFKREAKLQLIRPSGFFSFGQNAIEIEDLRFTFNIEKENRKEPNTAEIYITNLAENTRSELQRKPIHVRLEVGYDGESQRIFQGDLIFAQSKRERTGWVTKLQCGDGDRAYRFARSSKSFGKGVKRRDIIKQLAKDAGLKVPENVDEAKEFVSELVTGGVIDGATQKMMDKYINPTGKQWSIQDGRWQILGPNETRGEAAELINQSTGMIGSPEFGAPVAGKKQPVLTVRTLINPRITPGGKIAVQSSQIEGVFKVEKVRHSGDTRGEDWMSTIEAKAI